MLPPAQSLGPIPAVVLACLQPGAFRLILHPGVGLANGGIPRDVAADLIPLPLRCPNKPVWVQLAPHGNVIQVWQR